MAETKRSTYRIEVRDSDGNDCTVFDALVTAETKDAAVARLWTYLDEAYPDDESDGGDGTFHPCDCACDHMVGNGQTPVVGLCEDCQDGWECSHGGLLVDHDGIDTFPTVAHARDAHAVETYYHSLIDLTDDEVAR